MTAVARKAQPTAGPDMTPLLDVVFILLIFFIVTASFLYENGLQIGFSKPDKGPVPPDSPIAFQIDAGGNLLHGGRLIDPWAIEAIVKAEHTARPKAAVVISAHAAAPTGQIVRIYDEALKAGMDRTRIGVTVTE